MTTVRRTIRHTPDAVFAALTDPRTYPHWLVGCKDIRSVDPHWPEPGARFHHRVGLLGPLTIADNTEVKAINAPRILSLEVRARPMGRGRATFQLQPAPPDGGAPGTVVELDEVPIGLLRPTAPLLDPVTRHRNQTSLRNLERFLDAA